MLNCREVGTVVLLQLVYTLEQFDRYLYATAKIPFIHYHGTEYCKLYLVKSRPSDLPTFSAVLIGPAFTLVYTITGVCMGFLSNHSHRVKWLSWIVIGWSAMIFLVGWTTAFWQVALTRFG